jgi:hypothetical protein
MNIKRLILAIIAGYIVVFLSDWLIHGIWMAADYAATPQLWRPEAEMASKMGWMLAGQLLTVVTFVLLWTRWASTAKLTCAIGFGLLMGMFSGVWAIVIYVVTPTPCPIACKWFFAGIVQCILLGIVTFFVYKPKADVVAP